MPWPQLPRKVCFKSWEGAIFSQPVLGIFADERVDALEVATTTMRAIQAEDVRSSFDHLGDHLLQSVVAQARPLCLKTCRIITHICPIVVLYQGQFQLHHPC